MGLLNLVRYVTLGVDTVKVNNFFETISTDWTYDNFKKVHFRQVEYGANRVDPSRLHGRELEAYMQAKTIETEYDEESRNTGRLIRDERRAKQTIEGPTDRMQSLPVSRIQNRLEQYL